MQNLIPVNFWIVKTILSYFLDIAATESNFYI